ncbi:MAG: cysteine hydrolase family protein [Nocardioides sp.]
MNSPTTGLLVVDVQNDVMGSSVNRDQVIANIGSLVDRARERGVPVVWVRHHAERELQLGTPGWEIVPELTPADGEPIVDKAFSDSFAQTDLEDVLKAAGIGGLVLCGAQTDACVRNTFYGGLYRGYPMTLVADAHTTEDMQQWGVGYTPEQSIAVLNAQAAFTVLPDVRGAVTTTAEAFGG